MRAVWSILLAVCVAAVAVRAPHVRRSHPNATLSAHAIAHHHHVRSHRVPATVVAIVRLPARDIAHVDLTIAPPRLSIDPAPLVVVARGPPA